MSSSAAKANEPTMEEILASIRRIIADDEAPIAPAIKDEPAKETLVKAAPVASAEDDVDMDGMSQADIDAMLASFDTVAPEPAPPKTEAKPKEAPQPSAPAAKAQPETEKVPEPASNEVEDVLELTKPVEAKVKAEAADIEFREAKDDLDGDSDAAVAAAWGVDAEDVEPAPAKSPSASTEAIAADIEERLIAPAAQSAIAASFGSLSHAVLSRNSRTIEDLVADMLRPMLKQWLDTNLPDMVERMVRAEIQRLTRDGR